MTKTYTAANGQTITEDMIDGWCAAYEKGEFPASERTVGGVVRGRPPLSNDETVTLSVKVPFAMKEAIRRRAAEKGITPSEYARLAINEKLLEAS